MYISLELSIYYYIHISHVPGYLAALFPTKPNLFKRNNYFLLYLFFSRAQL